MNNLAYKPTTPWAIDEAGTFFSEVASRAPVRYLWSARRKDGIGWNAGYEGRIGQGGWKVDVRLSVDDALMNNIDRDTLIHALVVNIHDQLATAQPPQPADGEA
jgi:hypothetical protein